MIRPPDEPTDAEREHLARALLAALREPAMGPVSYPELAEHLAERVRAAGFRWVGVS